MKSDCKTTAIQTNKPQLGVVFWLLLFSLIAHELTSIAWAQPEPSKTLSKQQDSQPAETNPNTLQDDQSKLTDGLLDLLNDPSSMAAIPGAKSSLQPQPNQPSPRNETGTRSDQANRPSNPLIDVQNKMLQAATMLQQPKLKSTVKIQAEIVQHLDDLIAQLERQDNSQQNSSQNSSQQRQQRMESQSQLENQSAANKQEQRTASDQPGNDRSPPAKNADMSVRTKDPSALQQNVWGHLPSRVRAQMESRMVEEFLPSYRAKIEEYYRSLMEESERR